MKDGRILLIAFAVFVALIGMPAMASVVSGYSKKIQIFAAAIANAEGYGVPGARPTVNNNPGDLMEAGNSGVDDKGYGIFSTAQAGWNALYHQLQIIVNGQSANYTLDMTISDMAWTYTSTQQDAWSENVAAYLNQQYGGGISINTSIRGLLT